MSGSGSYSRSMKFLLAIILSSITTPSLSAHPHVFVDTGLELIVEGRGQLTHVRVTWEYDEFYSLLITEDLSLDPDGDGILTEAEITKLKGFDMQWIEGFNGDLVVADGDTLATLSGPRDITASFSDGRITTTHVRALERPMLPGETATIKAYDPTYYTAYEVTHPVTVIGDSACDVRLKVPELNSGLMDLQQQLATLDSQMDPLDAGLPEIGAQIASSVIFTCGAS